MLKQESEEQFRLGESLKQCNLDIVYYCLASPDSKHSSLLFVTFINEDISCALELNEDFIYTELVSCLCYYILDHPLMRGSYIYTKRRKTFIRFKEEIKLQQLSVMRFK
jgi:hypothetical protein